MLACQVTEGTITSRPCRAPAAKTAEWMVAVPLHMATAYLVPTKSRNSSSNLSISSYALS